MRLEITATLAVIKAFSYDDDAPWPEAADGGGSALMLANPAANPDHALPASWIASAALGGQPVGVPLDPGYTQWAAWSFPAVQAPEPRTNREADFDGDGLPNLIEYLTGNNPQVPETPAALQWSIASGQGGTVILRVAFSRLPGLAGYELTAQSSTDLNTWEAGFLLTGSAPQANGATLQQWEKSLPANAARVYLRLKATPSP